MEITRLIPIVEATCRHLLSQQDRNVYSRTYGCFDRRYWGWKLVDYAEATYQRGVYPLAWLLGRTEDEKAARVLHEAVVAGLQFSAQIQHPDGSFDQAFPHEHSFGATAFLLHPSLSAYRIVRDEIDVALTNAIEGSLRKAADFLCHHHEAHGLISNHLAGAALSLLDCAGFFGETRYEKRAAELVAHIIDQQSPEGWFVEYEGADPGYQTLCLYYLAQVFWLRPEPALRNAIEKAVDFLSWFVHPDGTFGGAYGSRRTEIYYPGGLTLLSGEFPLAHSMTNFMLQSIFDRRTVTVEDVDIGNIAPLLSNYIAMLDADLPSEDSPRPPLPWQREGSARNFDGAGIYIRSTSRYYTVIGASNGGVMKIYDRGQGRLLRSDGGYVGRLDRGEYITTQMTNLNPIVEITADQMCIEVPFYVMLRSLPTPFRFLLLRILNLTLMRNLSLGNSFKALLVRLLISGKRRAPLSLKRRITFGQNQISIQDSFSLKGKLHLSWLECGRDFSAIHMASANYFENYAAASTTKDAQVVSVENLVETGHLETGVTI